MELSACKEKLVRFVLLLINFEPFFILMNQIIIYGYLHELFRLCETYLRHSIVFLLHHNRTDVRQAHSLLVLVLEIIEDVEGFRVD